MQGPFWLLTISKTNFLSVFPFFPIYTWKDFCHSCIVYYRRTSYGCDKVSWSLPLLFLNILYLGLLMLKQCICKLCLEIDIDRLKCTTKNPTFIMLKDHKTNFRTSTPCWLLNPCKSELGKISKMILETSKKYLVDLLNLNQWKNSDMVINWFCSIKSKSQCAFIQLDIMEFYPSMMETILDNVLSMQTTHRNFGWRLVNN